MIDELSGRTPQHTGLDAAYGGSRPFPSLRHGLVVGDHPAVGRQLPQPSVEGRRLDDLLGTGFAIVVDDASIAAGVADGLDPRWARIATTVQVPSATLPFALPPAGCVIVRPDRYVAAVCLDAAELAAASAALLTHITNDRSVSSG